VTAPELTPNTSGNPFVEVFFSPDDLPAEAARLRVYRFSDNRTWLVRGGVDIVPGVAALDWECPFQSSVSYRAEMFDDTGLSLGFTDVGTTSLDYSGTVVHQPLDPSLWSPVVILEKSADKILRPTRGDFTRTEAGIANWIGANRGGLVDVSIDLLAETLDAAELMQAMLGSYTQQQVRVLCIRTTDNIRWPRTFFASGDLAEVDVDVAQGGETVRFVGQVSEVRPPFPGLVTPLLTYDDLDAAYSTYDERDAAYATYTDMDRDYSLAGLAG
jgi:hypothetical protein